jgi:hypothetical protein
LVKLATGAVHVPVLVVDDTAVPTVDGLKSQDTQLLPSAVASNCKVPTYVGEMVRLAEDAPLGTVSSTHDPAVAHAVLAALMYPLLFICAWSGSPSNANNETKRISFFISGS